MRQLRQDRSHSEGLLTVDAERIFTEQSQCRFKIVRAISEEAEVRINGFLQGPSYSIQVSLLYMSIWTRAVEEETNNKTAGFIDDRSVRSNDVETEKEEADALIAGWRLSKYLES